MRMSYSSWRTPVEREITVANREELIAAVSWWAGWCTDHEDTLPELTKLGGLLMEVKDQMRADRPEAGTKP